MSLNTAQQEALDHLRASYIGPEDGESEVMRDLPQLRYPVGMLFPQPAESGQGAPVDDDSISADVEQGDVEEAAAEVPLAEDWRPSSVAISFITDGDSIVCRPSGGTYEAEETQGRAQQWRRRPFAFAGVELALSSPSVQLMAGHVPFEVGSRWREFSDVHLVTVHIRVLSSSLGSDRADVARMLFQVGLAVEPASGGRILEYDTSGSLDLDEESEELRLRYRNHKTYAVGHGMAADWSLTSEGECTSVFLTPVPSYVVPAIETTKLEDRSDAARALNLAFLGGVDGEPTRVLPVLDSFVDAFSRWVEAQEARVETFGRARSTAARIAARSRTTADRMRQGVDALREPGNDHLRTAFSLAMAAMRRQMRQGNIKRGEDPGDPAWRPFQLGFLLASLASTVDDQHPDRELVDLIWFPTGGGKTEAYLGLAAIEIFRRRLDYGVEGGGTAVITRYTLRLLSSQQFQRAAALICAMEIIRRTDSRAKGMARFSIGLWIGNEASPGTRVEAVEALKHLRSVTDPKTANRFQIETCPWCGHSLLPRRRSEDAGAYGMRLSGKDVILHCTDQNCEFAEELPLSVVDEAIYDDPPTILLGTVDKFARLQFKPKAGRILGLGTIFRQPSIIIQDELHLLSGPLGTTVAVFDAVIQTLLKSHGSTPKIIASTATIRASEEQVRGLYGRRVALFPPSGLDDDRTFFSQPVATGEGRLYVGLMPQSLSQASALVSTTAPLLELPAVIDEQAADLDAYWTLVMYHNSLRELGRSNALVRDDVNGRLATRAERSGREQRNLDADTVEELTSRKTAEELPSVLRALETPHGGSKKALDVVLSSNMLSVGIDVPRLALMLMVGQPKTTAEYIQSTSRVGRGSTQGIICTLFRSNRARDRSHFETFRSFHEALYRSVEPTSVTPWSISSRDRSLAGAWVALVRNTTYLGLADNDDARNMDWEDARTRASMEDLIDEVVGIVEKSDPAEAPSTRAKLVELATEWSYRAGQARPQGSGLGFERRRGGGDALLKRFGEPGEGWLVGDSMRSVEPNVAIEIREPGDE